MNLDQDEVTRAVGDRYAAGAQAVEDELCCPVDYDAQYLKVMPAEILDRDYGCGDPSKFLKPGETVLDLGSGGGKICYIASQVVGKEGSVIGVDMTPDMLDLARRHRADVAEKIGWSNVEFFRGRIEDLELDYDRLDQWLRANPVTDVASYEAMEAERERLCRDEPMVASDSIDAVVSNCVLNLVAPELKRQLFEEIFRVVKEGGRAVISDIVSDQEVPLAMQQDPELWSGCISGAFEEQAFSEAFRAAGFTDVEVLVRQDEPWRVVDGIDFRSVTVAAYKGKGGVRLENEASSGCCAPAPSSESSSGGCC
jgi:ubiquinone/menaquinone biosynthesis C-methylase UbiE